MVFQDSRGNRRAFFVTLPILAQIFACSPGAEKAPGDGNGGAAGSGTASGGTSAGNAGATAASGGTGAGAVSFGGAAGIGGGAGSGPGGGSAGVGGTAGSTGNAGGAAGSAGTGGAGPYPGTVIVQDNFDQRMAGMPPDPTKWEPYGVGDANPPAVDAGRFRSSPNAALVTSTSSGKGSFLVPLVGFPVMGNTFYARVFINWEKATTAISGHSGFLVGAAARQNNGTEVRLGISSKGPGNVPRMDLNLIGATDGMGGEVTRYSNGYTDGGNPNDFTGTGFQFAANTWYCVEALFNGTMNAAEFRVWIDGSEVVEMRVTDFRGNTNGAPRVNWAPTYQFLKIGAQDYDANLGRIWYDDVFVGTAPVGCSR